MRRSETNNNKAPTNTYLKRYSVISQNIEIWDYNCGANNFSMTLIFLGHRLQEIERQDYGSGDSDCIGAERRKERQERINRKEERKEMRDPGIQEEAYLRDDEITTGSISLSGSPKGASVYLDGDHVAYIPCNILEVEAGYHKVIIKSDGYIDQEIIIEVEPGVTFSTYIDLTKVPVK